MRHGAGLSTPARWFGRYMPRQVTGTRRTMVATDYWERGLTYMGYSLNPQLDYQGLTTGNSPGRGSLGLTLSLLISD